MSTPKPGTYTVVTPSVMDAGASADAATVGSRVRTSPDDWSNADAASTMRSAASKQPRTLAGRVALIVVGIVLVLVGIPMLVLPGPGLVAIAGGIGCIVAGLGLSKRAKTPGSVNARR